jgi:Family of unknown function (DUF6282)
MAAVFPEAEDLVPKEGMSVLKDGSLTQEAKEVLRIAREAEIMVGTGHISPDESLALMSEAQHIGYNRLVFTHPWSPSIAASDEDRGKARLGVFPLCP